MEIKQKVTLEKKGDSLVLKQKDIQLAKKGATEFTINLNWKTGLENKPKPTGFFGKIVAALTPDDGIDLDLGCFFKLRNGTAFGNMLGMGGSDRSVIDGLNFDGNKARQGSLKKAPWIYHTGDDRTGSDAAGESILVNLDQCFNIERMTIYAYIYGGAPQWSQTDAVVTVNVPGQSPIEVGMGQQGSQEMACVIAELSFSAQGDITVSKHVTFHDGHEAMDHAYGWGMQWQAGSKS